MVKPVSKSHALNLRAKAGVDRLVLMTDRKRLPNPDSAIAKLPYGSIVILRDYDHPKRLELAKRLRGICRNAGCWFLVAGDVRLARTVGADGVHLPEYMLWDRPLNLNGFSLVSAACHSKQAMWRAKTIGVDLAIVSPVFPTNSHPGAPALGIHRFARLVAGHKMAVAALGGVSKRTASRLRGIKLAAIAGISGIAD